jgi:peptidoglycan pentaglycine glycine transferase (the first glycine)
MMQSIPSRPAWTDLAARFSNAHFLQSWEWGEAKTKYGWSAERYAWFAPDGAPAACAQILLRTMRIGFMRATVAYIPKGPLWENMDAAFRERVLADLESFARVRRVIELKMDPDIPLGFGLPGTPDDRVNAAGQDTTTILTQRGWIRSREQIQMPNTVALDLNPPEPDLLAHMKQKTRYNIRLAEKHGVTIRAGSEADFPMLYRMYAGTGARDGFIVRPEEYYHTVWGGLMRAGFAMPLIAEVDAQPVAAIVLFRYGPRTWYMHGMSANIHREKMPNHLLQWEGIRWAKQQGCTSYDFWGAPDHFDPSDRMWGVFQFKQGFGGEVIRYLGAWDFAPSSVGYRAYHSLLPNVLRVMRIFARRRTQAAAESV